MTWDGDCMQGHGHADGQPSPRAQGGRAEEAAGACASQVTSAARDRLHVTNDAGRRFEVRCIRRGERYGLNGCLAHDRDEPVVEFTDVTPAGGPGPVAGPEFVARFPANVLLGRDAGADLWLVGQNVAWRLSPEQVRVVREWVGS